MTGSGEAGGCIGYSLTTDEGERLEVPAGRALIGRDPEADLVLGGDRVSWRHAVVLNLYGQFWVEDLDSTNGTFVNGRRVKSVTLRPGDQVAVGERRLEVALLGPVPIPAGPAAGALPGELVRPSLPGPVPMVLPEGGARNTRRWRRARRQLKVLSQLGTTLARDADWDQVVEQVLDALVEGLDAERVFYLRVQRASGAEDGAPVTVRRRVRDASGPAEPSVSIVRRAVQERLVLATVDAAHDQRFRSAGSVLGQNIRSAMCAPVWVGEGIEGALYVDSLLDDLLFEDSDLWLLEVVAGQAGLALSRARATSGLREHAATIEAQRRELAAWNAGLEARVASQTEVLRARTAQLESLQRSRQVLAELAEHDLRNLVNTYQGTLGLLRQDLQARTSDVGLLEDFAATAGMVEGLVYDLCRSLALESSHLEQPEGHVTRRVGRDLQPTWFDPVLLVRQVLRRHQPNAALQQVALEASFPSGFRLHGDERLLLRVIENLITNSLRYVPVGGTIRVEGERVEVADASPGGDARLVVADTGPGIPEEARRLVFERHVRLGEAINSRHRGLGLYYCQAAIEAHGGRIFVEGTAGDCRMVMILPAAARLDAEG